MVLSRIAVGTASSVAHKGASTAAISTSFNTRTSSRPALLSLLAVVLAFTATFLNTAEANTYQPVSYSATAVLGSRLYIYGGLTNISSSTSYTSQFATLSLTNAFDTDDLPWEFLPGNITTAMAPGAGSRDQRRFIVGGSRNNVGHAPAIVFDSSLRTWSQTTDLPGDTTIMQNYHRDSPGMSLDQTNGMLIQFGGMNATNNITNDLTLLDTSKASNAMTWSYSGSLDSVPALYAPILLYIPNNKQTLIMGGCDLMDSTGTPSHCAAFDTLYTLSSDSAVSATPKASRISVNGTVPSARLMPCAVVMSDGNVLMLGGGDPTNALADAWILNTQSWTWFQRNITDFPVDGIMGHSCQLGPNDQILVIGGHSGVNFVQTPLSIIKIKNWSWACHYWVPGFSTGIKVGLAMTTVIVVGAIIAGLWIRWRRNKMAALEKVQGHGVKSKNSIRSKRTGGSGGSGRRKRSSKARQQSLEQQEPVELEGIQYHSHAYTREDQHTPEWDMTLTHGVYETPERGGIYAGDFASSPVGSCSSTIVGPTSSVMEEDRRAWREQEYEHRLESSRGMQQGHMQGEHERVEHTRGEETQIRPDLKSEIP
ncbi:hypothetical protein EDD21DRAFT_358142 [Dissophora ornata]|nr:hypothetical protein EDD21DRAFT_358142 [Dissophora ornata]